MKEVNITCTYGTLIYAFMNMNLFSFYAAVCVYEIYHGI